MEFKLLIFAFATLLPTADCYCSSTTLLASTYSKSKTVQFSYYDYCSISIRPSYSSYYLEISWSSSNFDVKGDMPFCKENYVEVFLTSSYRSIGRFCSNNAGQPFIMYSWDGYARITYSANGYATGTGFKFYYRLKSKSSNYIGLSPSSTLCQNIYNYGSSGLIFSSGWPNGYQSSYSSCDYHIQKPYSYQGIYVAFMDINLYSTYWNGGSDCLQVYGSNFSLYATNAVSSRLCGTNYVKTYTTYDVYLRISFDRNNRASYSSTRGFVAGYVMFKNPSNTDRSDAETSSKSSSAAVAISLSIVIPGIVILVLFIAIFTYKKHRQRRTPASTSVSQTQTTNAVPTSQQITSQQAVPTLPSLSHTNAAYSSSQYAYPTATIQTGSYPVASHVPSYPTPYPSVQNNAVGNNYQQVSFVVTPQAGSIPPGVLEQQIAFQGQVQQSSRIETTASATTPNYAQTITPVETNQTGPPPPYYPANGR